MKPGVPANPFRREWLAVYPNHPRPLPLRSQWISAPGLGGKKVSDRLWTIEDGKTAIYIHKELLDD